MLGKDVRLSCLLLAYEDIEGKVELWEMPPVVAPALLVRGCCWCSPLRLLRANSPTGSSPMSVKRWLVVLPEPMGPWLLSVRLGDLAGRTGLG